MNHVTVIVEQTIFNGKKVYLFIYYRVFFSVCICVLQGVFSDENSRESVTM